MVIEYDGVWIIHDFDFGGPNNKNPLVEHGTGDFIQCETAVTLALHRAGPQKTSLHRTSLHAHCSLKILKALTLAQ